MSYLWWRGSSRRRIPSFMRTKPEASTTGKTRTFSTAPTENAGVAAVLALVLGLFGPMGIGHIYVGRVRRGLLLLVVGIVLGVLTWGSFIVGFFAFRLGFIGAIFFGIILFVLWIWQTYNAHNLAKKFNRLVQETGNEPW